MIHWRLTPAARSDMRAIWRYSVKNWGIDQADKYVRQIERDLTAAAEGSPLVQRFDNFWRIKSGRHLCFFTKLENGGLEIIRILHERMDVEGQLSD